MIHKLPRHVISTSEYLKFEPDHKLFDIAGKLISFSEEHSKMWMTLEKYQKIKDDDLWVWVYLHKIYAYTSFPAYFNLSTNERIQLSKRINTLTSKLEKEYSKYQLSFELVATSDPFPTGFKGIHILDDFDFHNRQRFDLDAYKCDFINVLKNAAIRASEKIEEANLASKAYGTRPTAMRLIRELHTLHMKSYNRPLNSVIITVVKSLLGFDYDASDIRKAVTRVGKKQNKI